MPTSVPNLNLLASFVSSTAPSLLQAAYVRLWNELSTTDLYGILKRAS